jgi:hypothetical protein
MTITPPSRTSTFLLVLLTAAFSAQAKIPNSSWKTGVLKKVTRDHIARESGELGKKPPKHGVYINYYFIEADSSLYEADDVRLKENEKGFPVSVEGPVKFFPSGNDMYVLDSRGKQHKLRLLNILPAEVKASAQGPAK